MNDRRERPPKEIGPFTTLVLGGGGTKGLSILGSLAYLHQKGLLQVNKISGTSIGAIIGVLFGLGVSPKKIFKVALGVETPLQGDKSNLSKILKKYGIWSLTKSLGPFIRILFSHFGGKSPTLLEYYQKTGVHLRVCACNINNLEAVYFDHISHPGVKVVDTLRATCCIPGLFRAVKIDGDYYVDGGFVKNFPLDAWPANTVPDHEIVGISVSGFPLREEINDVWGYISRVSALAIITHTKSAVRARPGVLVVESILEGVPLVPTAITPEIKKSIFEKGIKDAKARVDKARKH
jgi:NTE family protein